jgi:dTDP-glucose 4,6-dehydratase
LTFLSYYNRIFANLPNLYKESMNILITGGCGFIGSNFTRYILKKNENVRVVNLDKLTYAGNPANLVDLASHYPDRYQFIKGDIGDKVAVQKIFDTYDITWIVHFAAESHVDRSIIGPEVFLHTNIIGTFTLLEAALGCWPLKDPEQLKGRRFLHISTDEVYGSLDESGYFTEKTAYDPSSPYSASKASSDHLVNAYYRTYGLPTIITNCSNNYGPYQFPEKLIPLMIHNALKGIELPVYGDGENVRDWIYVEDHCEALLEVLEKGDPGERYNIGGNSERRNKEVVLLICNELDKQLGLINDRPRKDLIRFVSDRPGHDRRYAIDGSKIREELGWEPAVSFEEGIRLTIEWYLQNPEWVEGILNGSYREYYRKQYGGRLSEQES